MRPLLLFVKDLGNEVSCFPPRACRLRGFSVPLPPSTDEGCSSLCRLLGPGWHHALRLPCSLRATPVSSRPWVSSSSSAPSRPRRVGAGTCPRLNLAAFFLLGIFERSMQHSFFGVVYIDVGGSDHGLWCVLAQLSAQLVLAHLGPVALTLP